MSDRSLFKNSWIPALSLSLQRELFRKSIHMGIALVPSLAALNRGATMLALLAGAALFAWAESQRLSGRRIPFISTTTVLASRDRDRGKAVLGPITLALGAFAALAFFPLPAAAVAIYALAFGDGLSSLAGKIFGRHQIPFTGGKTLEGSLTAFGAITLSCWSVTRDWGLSLAVGLGTTLVEALPLEDLDNMMIPLTAGLLVTLL